MYPSFILGVIGSQYVMADESSQRTLVTGCDRGGDQAEELMTKYLITPDFPAYCKISMPTAACKWT